MLFFLVFEVALHGSLQKGVRHECLLVLKFGLYFRTVLRLWTEEFIVSVLLLIFRTLLKGCIRLWTEEFIVSVLMLIFRTLLKGCRIEVAWITTFLSETMFFTNSKGLG